MLVFSTLAIIALAGYFAWFAVTASTAHETVQAGLLCCLSLLAALEHFFLAIPFRDSRLWQWALGEPTERKEI
jgi:hypothetical protein